MARLYGDQPQLAVTAGIPYGAIEGNPVLYFFNNNFVYLKIKN